MKETIKKFRKGEVISNNDLRSLLYHYRQLSSLLDAHDATYELVRKDVANELDRAKKMYEARFNQPWFFTNID